MKLTAGAIGVILAVLILIFVGFYARSRLAEAKEFFETRLNPASDKNLVYSGVSKLVQSATGEEDATLGTKIYDWVDAVYDFLPWLESDKQKNERLMKQPAKREVNGL